MMIPRGSCAIAFVGPLPPPLHGFSAICAAMLARLQSTAPVAQFDRAPRAKGRARQLRRELCEVTRYIHTVRLNPKISLYLALSGGLGQILDGLYVLIAKFYRRPIFVHHHSFAYINKPTLISNLTFHLLRNATHIALSREMGRKLAERYELNQDRVEVLSNAAFYGPATELVQVAAIGKTPICIGFLSNITFAKGLVEFFDVLTELHRLAVPYSAYIAGPVSPDVRTTLDRLLAKTRHVNYLGPLYDEEKSKFYKRLDVLLFPTKYVNEAEPLVIHEAMQSGVHVIACARGAIPEMLSRSAGLAFDESSFVMSAAAAIRAFNLDRTGLALAQRLSYEQAHRLRLGAERRLVELVERIRSGDS